MTEIEGLLLHKLPETNFDKILYFIYKDQMWMRGENFVTRVLSVPLGVRTMEFEFESCVD